VRSNETRRKSFLEERGVGEEKFTNLLLETRIPSKNTSNYKHEHRISSNSKAIFLQIIGERSRHKIQL
jgi:hypothetical protein